MGVVAIVWFWLAVICVVDASWLRLALIGIL